MLRFCTRLTTTLLLCLFSLVLIAQNPTVTGELKTWHRVTLTWAGPQSSETAATNPFADYALNVTFTNGDKTYVVPGFYAADGDAAETSATAGDKWRVHFAPDETGTWNYAVSFKTGTDVAVEGGGASAGAMDGQTGTLNIATTDKTGRDHRGKGRLEYVGEHYLRYAATGEYFVKAGADAPENTLAYEDFDEVPDRGGRRKSWQPHQQDYVASEAAAYTWQNGKGSELLGVVNYLSGKGVNAFSFLTFNIRGDDRNCFPHLLSVPIENYGGPNAWDEVHHDRFDVSRMAQWERIFSYADVKGMYLHFKLQETENDDLMDGGNVDRERKLYFRELIARFGHHLALNWNMGEENVQTTQQRKDMATYFANTDPYNHLRVIHTYPGQKNQVYTPLLGSNSDYTGLSLQTSGNAQTQNHGDAAEWVNKSANAGKKWVVAVDEPGSASIGVDSDPRDRKPTRHRVVWGTLMAGGAGTEFYYGYQSGCGDLQCQDHRTRDEKYTDAAFALTFFQDHFQPYLPNVVNDNDLTAAGDDFVLYKANTAYAVYRPDGGTTAITLPTGDWDVSWYNPRTGVMGTKQTLSNGTLVAPDNNDWVALLVPGICLEGLVCDDGNDCTENDVLDANCNCAGTPLADADDDGICDAEDACPNFDDGLIGTACDDGDPDTTNDTFRDDCACRGVPPGQQTDFYFEAECATFGDAFARTSSSNASDGAFLLALDNGTFLPNAPTGDQFYISLTVDVPQAGDYKIFARTLTTEDGDDSFWVRHVGGSWVRWNKIGFPYATPGFTWNQVGQWTNGDSSTPVTFALAEGENVIEFAYREPGIQLDKIFVTLSGSFPDGQGGLAENCAALPVDWLSFTARPAGKIVRLDWSVANAIDNRRFLVQHKGAAAGALFRTIGELPAEDGAGTQFYTFQHEDPSPGSNEYRIVQQDLDGTLHYSDIRALKFGGEVVTAYPNPFANTLRLDLPDGLEGLTMHDVHGWVVFERGSAAVGALDLDLGDLAAGVYLVRGVSGGEEWVLRVVRR